MPRNRRRRPTIESLSARRLLAAVDIADDLTAAPASIVSVPVNIDDADGVRGAEIRLSYNSDLLDLDQADVTAGSVWDSGNDTQLTVNVDDATGTIVIFVSSSSELAATAGSLVELRFTVDGEATVGTSTVLDLTSVVLNEGQLSVTPSPIAGDDETDGTLTIVASGSETISGFVFADADANGSLDAGEAIPGVTITLVNTTSGAQQQTVTAADGRYQFTELPAGTYTITQQQPVAYLDDGDNELTATLTAGDALQDQNFTELGLLPAFLYNRLLTTLVMPIGSDAWSSEIGRTNDNAESGSVATAPTITSASVAATSLNSLDAANESATAAAATSDLLLNVSGGEGEMVPATTDAIIGTFPSPAPVSAVLPKNKTQDEDEVLDQVYATTQLW
ncbi:cohesin domain-containing protein [Stieleria sp. ICT_E10.1]|uniref:cohesin domain-containing protein n=1 Tax=Stieleria sedimenti TaxID=2976331 RepID=UPI00217FCC26|nr:cohesin domain-containing protein [Stieleria sedimenti]MCS7466266.1 cohesin domain-containing protein [Stieleria sedimenti]